ncbi:metalloregulator ArsR/SmtB family transcription factor [soil metagenome]
MSQLARKRDPFDALGDPTRRAILKLVSQDPSSVQQIADQLPVSRPAVSRHLRLLKDAGHVSVEQVGTRNLYRLDDLGADEVRQYLEGVWGEAISRFQIYAENTSSKLADEEIFS